VSLAVALVAGLVLGVGTAVWAFRRLGPRVTAEAAVFLVVVDTAAFLLWPWGIVVIALSMVVLAAGAQVLVVRRAVDATIEWVPAHELDAAVAQRVARLEEVGFRLAVPLRFSPRHLTPTDVALMWWEGRPVVAVVHAIRGSGQGRVALRSPVGASGCLSTTTSVVTGAPSTVTWSRPDAGPQELVDAHRQVLAWAEASGLTVHPVVADQVEALYRTWEERDAAFVRGMGLIELARFGRRSAAPRVPPWEQPGAPERLGD
jgi:hypothetical protein